MVNKLQALKSKIFELYWNRNKHALVHSRIEWQANR